MRPDALNESPSVHHVGSEIAHYAWDRDLTPALKVESGDTVTFEIRGGSDNYLTRHSTRDDIARRPPFHGHALAGPVWINGARAGDVLEIEILKIETWDWGYTYIAPGMGLLQEDFPDEYLKIWDLSNGITAQLRPGIDVPIEPFLGVVGLAPGDVGPHSTMPPRRTGGNLDLKHLASGSTVWLPVEADGAMLSVGDAHAAQGDGEVCVTAIETGATATLRITLRRDVVISAPEFKTAGRLTPAANVGPWYGTCGIGPDLMSATKDAVRAMLRYLERRHDLTTQEAYVLASVAVDLKITEVVDAPNWVVSACLPLGIFGSTAGRH